MVAQQIAIRRDTTVNWTTSNPVLGIGEPALDLDTGYVRYGDGSTPWLDLPVAERQFAEQAELAANAAEVARAEAVAAAAGATGATDAGVSNLLNDPISQVRTILNDDYVATNELIVNVRDFGAAGDGITDDTASVRAAIAFACAEAVVRGDGTGYKSYLSVVFFPAGRYVVSEEGALNCTTNAVRGYCLRGAGYQVSEIMYTHTPATGADSFALTNGGATWFAFSYVEDLSFFGNGTNSAWRLQTQAGAPQACRFRRVNFTNLKKCVTVEYGSSNSNGDLFRFDACKASDIKEGGWVFGIPDVRTSQSIVHAFDNCDFESIQGDILHFKAGGSVEVRGGSWIVNRTGRVIHIDDTSGAGIGFQAGTFTFYGTKIEWRHFVADADLDHAPLFYVNAQCNLSFNNMTFGQFVGNTQFATYDYGQLGGKGRVLFTNCYFPANMKIRITSDLGGYYGQSQPTVLFDTCVLTKQLFDMFSLVLANWYNHARQPTIAAWNTQKTDLAVPVDVTLWANYGSQMISPKLNNHTYIQSVTPLTTGMPVSIDGTARTVTFKLPRGGTIKRIGLVFEATGLAGDVTHTIKSDTTTLWTNTYAPSTGRKAAFSNDLMFAIGTEVQRTISVVCEGAFVASGGIPGYVVVEYY